MKQKKIPMRMCLGCREMKPKRDMIRIVRSTANGDTEGVISIDFRGKAPGRGAYICRDKACLEKAVSGKLLERCFESKIEPEVYDELRRQLAEGDSGEQ